MCCSMHATCRLVQLCHAFCPLICDLWSVMLICHGRDLRCQSNINTRPYVQQSYLAVRVGVPEGSVEGSRSIFLSRPVYTVSICILAVYWKLLELYLNSVDWREHWRLYHINRREFHKTPSHIQRKTSFMANTSVNEKRDREEKGRDGNFAYGGRVLSPAICSNPEIHTYDICPELWREVKRNCPLQCIARNEAMASPPGWGNLQHQYRSSNMATDLRNAFDSTGCVSQYPLLLHWLICTYSYLLCWTYFLVATYRNAGVVTLETRGISSWSCFVLLFLLVVNCVHCRSLVLGASSFLYWQ